MNDDKRYNGGKLNIWYNGFKLDGDITKISQTLQPEQGKEFIPGIVDGAATLKFTAAEDNVVNIDAQIPADLGKYVHTLATALDAVLASNSTPVNIIASMDLFRGILSEMYPIIPPAAFELIDGAKGDFRGVPFTLGTFEDGILGQITTDRFEVIDIKAE